MPFIGHVYTLLEASNDMPGYPISAYYLKNKIENELNGYFIGDEFILFINGPKAMTEIYMQNLPKSES